LTGSLKVDQIAISARGLTKYYGKTVGIEGLDLDVYQGELFGFLGPNGAGKTTFMRTLMGIFKPTRGTATVLGHDCWKDSVAVNREVGYLSGSAQLYDNLTGEEHIEFVSRFNGIGKDPGHSLAKRFELELDRKVQGYSSGMKQKLALILVLMKDSPLLIMDEPTNALDPLMQQKLNQVLRERKEGGTTILFSSHNLPEVERIADRVGAIREGHLVGTERIEDLRSKRLRNIEVIFNGAAPETLAGMEGVSNFTQVAGNRVQFRYKGAMNPLVRALASNDIADLNIGHASLEDVFMEFYGSEEGGEGQ
jgi:beta-exotoxin I transport system ATP-binding protein